MIEVSIGFLNETFPYCLTYLCRAYCFVHYFLFRYLFSLETILSPHCPQLFIVAFLVKAEMMVESGNNYLCLKDSVDVPAYEFLACRPGKFFCKLHNNNIIESGFPEQIEFFFLRCYQSKIFSCCIRIQHFPWVGVESDEHGFAVIFFSQVFQPVQDCLVSYMNPVERACCYNRIIYPCSLLKTIVNLHSATIEYL
jgi:hypothetical protein